MPIDLVDFEIKARESVIAFWTNREKAKQQQSKIGVIDQGERAGVTAGRNMDGFAAMITSLITANGLPASTIHQNRALLTLPGYFRPTKLWDLLVVHKGRLVAAIECKSQVGPSFGNNFNNRTEEAIGTAYDFRTAYREGAFGKHPKPFLGWMMLVEDTKGSRKPVRDRSPHFAVFPEFEGASYIKRYDMLCQRLAQEELYSSACVITSERDAAKTGEYKEVSELTGLKTFVTSLAGRIAAEAARS